MTLTSGNYRGNSVAISLTKIYSRVIGTRLAEHLDEHGLRAWSQAGGRKHLGVQDHHFVLQHLKEKYQTSKAKGGKATPLYVCFVDFEKAFDEINLQIMWKRLEERGIHGSFINALKAMYARVIQKVKVNGKTGDGFETMYGVKQGDPLSTDLFGVLIEILYEVMRATLG